MSSITLTTVDRKTRRRTLVWVTLYFGVMAVLMTWPLALKMGNQMVGQMGDNIYFVWMIGWMKKALFQLHANPFNVWFLNYPQGWNMAYTEITPAQLALAMPFSFLGGPVFAYNMALLLTFALSGVGMYLWVRRLTGRVDAALIAGTLFAFGPYRFAHFLIGHLNLAGTQWFPFYFMGLFELLGVAGQGGLLSNHLTEHSQSERRSVWKLAVLTGISLGLIGLTSQYYLYMALLISAFLAVISLVFLNRQRLRERAFWRQVLIAGVVAAPLVAAAIAPYVLLNQQGGLPDRNLGIVRMYSASPTDFFLPSTDHFLWGGWVGSHFNRDMWVEGTLYIGVVGLALAVVAFLRRKQLGHSKLMILLLLGSALAFLLALGTDLHWNGSPVSIHTPAFLSGLISRPEIPIPLPGYALFLYFPFYAKLRALMRFGVFVLVFVSAAAGLGAAWFLQRVKLRRQTLLAGLILALALLDFYPGPYTEFTRVQARPVDLWLAQQPGNGAVVQFPFILGEDQDQTYNTLVHGKPFVGGFFNAFPPAQYTRIRPVMERFPDAESVATLRQLGVTYVLVDQRKYEDMAALRSRVESFGLTYAATFGDQWVFLLEEK